MRMVQCVKLGRELPGLDYPPFGGELGEKIWNSVSEQAWNTFKAQFMTAMRGQRIQGGSDEATNIFLEQADQYFFGAGS